MILKDYLMEMHDKFAGQWSNYEEELFKAWDEIEPESISKVLPMQAWEEAQEQYSNGDVEDLFYPPAYEDFCMAPSVIQLGYEVDRDLLEKYSDSKSDVLEFCFDYIDGIIGVGLDPESHDNWLTHYTCEFSGIDPE